jgi:hypothetical protein
MSISAHSLRSLFRGFACLFIEPHRNHAEYVPEGSSMANSGGLQDVQKENSGKLCIIFVSAIKISRLQQLALTIGDASAKLIFGAEAEEVAIKRLLLLVDRRREPLSGPALVNRSYPGTLPLPP